MQVSAHDEDEQVDAIAAAAFDALDETELVTSLWIEDEFGEDALAALADAWCRSLLAPAEIASPVVRLPTTTREPSLTRRAA